MFCPYCGSENAEGTTFCGNCGANMADAAQPVQQVEPNQASHPQDPWAQQQAQQPYAAPDATQQQPYAAPDATQQQPYAAPQTPPVVPEVAAPTNPSAGSYITAEAPQPKKKRTGLIVALVILAVAVVGGVVFFTSSFGKAFTGAMQTATSKDAYVNEIYGFHFLPFTEDMTLAQEGDTAVKYTSESLQMTLYAQGNENVNGLDLQGVADFWAQNASSDDTIKNVTDDVCVVEQTEVNAEGKEIIGVYIFYCGTGNFQGICAEFTPEGYDALTDEQVNKMISSFVPGDLEAVHANLREGIGTGGTDTTGGNTGTSTGGNTGTGGTTGTGTSTSTGGNTGGNTGTSTGGNTGTEAISLTTYENARYGFSTPAPTSFDVSESVNGDGAIFSSTDLDMTITASGINNTTGMTPEQLVESLWKGDTNAATQEEDNHIVIIQQVGDRSEMIVGYVGDGSINTVTCEYPYSETTTTQEELAAEICKGFKPGDLTVSH